ncbi:MAG: aminotransferase class I/II-fold pyridoxal phosphate-dependent enzyme [Desulfobacteraceae bacterium]|nr:aminotransferase class I/II-fold pyridoxal phosphate-dependent enzyme [Desulfobacteraceae bacterium]MBC2718826.1 aminotransferase class I/II-fold pyridoxal phosphate-dependent enzyme [Desulfobacteraceae bacterium]
MKVFIDTNVLIDVAVRIDKYPDSFALLNKLMEFPDYSLWIAAVSVNNIQYVVSKLENETKANKLLELIREEFSIIPFRRSVFLQAMDNTNPDFEDAIQFYSAEEMNMDCIITRNPDDFTNSSVKVYTPSQFLEQWNVGKLNKKSQVPFLDLKAQHHQIFNDIDDRFADIMANTGFILGKYVDEFENGFGKLHDAKYCVGVSSGTDALHIAMMSLGIGHGDLVIVPVNTFIATAEAVSLCGAEPVFVDCDEYYNIDVQKLKEYLTAMSHELKARMKAVIPVHLYGQPANMNEIMALADEYGFKVVEDCCQAHLAKYDGEPVGSFGRFGAFSFYPGKNLGAYGEAGALITNDEALYEKARMIRQHGEIKRYHHSVVGHNYRMSAFQGAALSVKMQYIAEWTEKRQENARLYNELLAGIEGIQIPKEMPNSSCVYHLYVIQTDDRDGLREYLEQNGINTGIHYPISLHLQKVYEFLRYGKGDFPAAETAAKRILSLPMYPELTKGQISYVCEKVKEFGR